MSRNNTLSRRGFGRVLAASSLAAPALRPQAAPSREDELRAAHERRRASADALAKFRVPIATEPASIFRP